MPTTLSAAIDVPLVKYPLILSTKIYYKILALKVYPTATPPAYRAYAYLNKNS